MTKSIINKVQDFLTMVQQDGNRIYQIVNVELLLRRHPAEAVITFLKELDRDFGKQMVALLKEDKTSSLINELVVKRFRLKMAINTIRNNTKHQEAA